MADYPGTLDYFVDDSRVFLGASPHDAIVLHGTGGSPDQTAQQLGDWFRSDPAMSSVHFGIDRSGNVAQYVRLTDAAGGNCCVESGYDSFWQPYLDKYGALPGRLNRCTISIEHVNDSANSLPLSDAQKSASFRLVKWLCDQFNIPPDHVKTHASIAPITRARCPGSYPMDELKSYLQENSMLNLDDPVVSRYFTDGGNGTWKCKNTGVTLLGGILTFYRSYGGPALLGLPLAGENYSQPGAAYVVCERAIIMYDPNRKYDNPPIGGPCYLIHLDSPLAKTIILGAQSATMLNDMVRIALIAEKYK